MSFISQAKAEAAVFAPSVTAFHVPMASGSGQYGGLSDWSVFAPAIVNPRTTPFYIRFRAMYFTPGVGVLGLVNSARDKYVSVGLPTDVDTDLFLNLSGDAGTASIDMNVPNDQFPHVHTIVSNGTTLTWLVDGLNAIGSIPVGDVMPNELCDLAVFATGSGFVSVSDVVYGV